MVQGTIARKGRMKAHQHLIFVSQVIIVREVLEFKSLVTLVIINLQQVRHHVFHVLQENTVINQIHLLFKTVPLALTVQQELDLELNSYVLKELILTQQEMTLSRIVNNAL